MRMVNGRAGLMAAAFLALSAAPSQAAVLDNFNRPDSFDLGPDWTVLSGPMSIINGAMGVPTTRLPMGVAQYNGTVGNIVSFDFNVFGGSPLITLQMGSGAGLTTFYLSSEEADPFFDNVTIVGPWGRKTFNPYRAYFDGQVTASMIGTTASLSVKYMRQSETFYRQDVIQVDTGQPYLVAPVQIGMRGGVGFDNFGNNVNGVPEPSTWALMILGMGAGGAMLRRRRRELAG